MICDASRSRLNRRRFAQLAAIATGGAVFGGLDLTLEAANDMRGFIDVNVSCSQWPFGGARGWDMGTLCTALRRRGCSQAWTSSFDGIIHKDISAVNAWLYHECRRLGRGLLVPFGSINPASTGWNEDFQRCIGEFQMAGIRLHPNYHGYELNHPGFLRLLKLAAAHGTIVELAFAAEDNRTTNPLIRVSSVDLILLVDAVKDTSGLKLVLLNASSRVFSVRQLAEVVAVGQVYLEISMIEGLAAVELLLAQVPVDRVLFGSNAPLFYLESSLLKLQESRLDPEQLEAIRVANAKKVFSHRCCPTS